MDYVWTWVSSLLVTKNTNKDKQKKLRNEPKKILATVSCLAKNLLPIDEARREKELQDVLT